MRLGARDFIAKPFKLAEIELKVDKIMGERPAREYEQRRWRSPPNGRSLAIAKRPSSS